MLQPTPSPAPAMPCPPLIRLDYGTGTTPADRLKSQRGSGAGIAVVNWPNSTPYAFGWDGRYGYDYRPLEAQLDGLQAEQPGLRFILSFGSLHGTPYYWAKDHPQELAVFNCGRKMQQASLGSEAWKRDSVKAARRFAAHFAKGRRAGRIVGFMPYSTGVDWRGIGETFVNIPEKETPKGFEFPLEGDISIPMRNAFRKYLQAKYGTADALRDAWRDPGVSFNTVELPGRIELRSPGQRSRDYFECYNRLNADLALAWIQALKEGAPDKHVIIGHGTVYGWPAENIHPQGSGHNEPERLLASEALTALISPAAAPFGQMCALAQHPLGSLRLHGKRHVYSVEPPNQSRINLPELKNGITLAAGYAAVHGSHLAWGEVRHGPGSMQDDRGRFSPLPYDHPEIRVLMSTLGTWHASHLANQPEGVAGMAVFISPRGSHYRAMETRFNRERIEAFRNGVLSRAGIPFDEYLLSDFSAVAGRYAAWVFIDCPDMDAATWDCVRREPGRCLFATAGRPVSDPAELQEFATGLGLHAWCAPGDRIHANARALVYAALTEGTKQVRFPHPVTVFDVPTGKIVASATTRIHFTASAGRVRLFDLVRA